MIRHTLVAGLAIAAALTHGAAAASPATLDGQRKTSHTYSGMLSGPSVYAGITETGVGGGIRPRREWCTVQTCDITELALRLPAGRQSGRLVVDLTYGPSASLRLAVYRPDGSELPSPSFCCLADRIVATQLPAGNYTVVVYVEAGASKFDVELTWKANPPHRSAATSS